jgi:filamentous hemagglutinin
MAGDAKANEARQLVVNKAAGAEFEAYGKVNILSKSQTDVQPQVTIMSRGPSGLKVRVDFLGTDVVTGEMRLSDMKASASAPFTGNQRRVYPEHEIYGGIIVSDSKPPYVRGTLTPPRPVDIFRKLK